jgi:hypothetical protein
LFRPALIGGTGAAAITLNLLFGLDSHCRYVVY